MALTLTNVSLPTSTVDGNTYVMGSSFTPVAGDLLVVLVMAAGTVDTAPTLTSNANGITFTLLAPKPAKQGNAASGKDSLYCFVADQLVPASPVAMTLTFSVPNDPAEGMIASVARWAGALQAGTGAIRQTASVSDGVSGTAPSVTYSQAPLTGNGQLFFNAYTSTAPLNPTNWTTRRTVTIATPTAGHAYHSVNSGQTATTVASPTTGVGAWAATLIEIDATAGGGGGGLPKVAPDPRLVGEAFLPAVWRAANW